MSRLFNDTNVVVAVAIGAAHSTQTIALAASLQLTVEGRSLRMCISCVHCLSVAISSPLFFDRHTLFTSISQLFLQDSKQPHTHTTLTNCIRQNRLNVHIDTIKWNEFRRHSIAVSFSLFSHWGSQTTKGIKTITRDNKNEAKKMRRRNKNSIQYIKLRAI